MVSDDLVDLGLISAALNVIAALTLLYVMQKITADAGFRCGRAVAKLAQRLALAAAVIVLFANAGEMLYYDIDPRPLNVLGETMMVAALVWLSAVLPRVSAAKISAVTTA